MEGKNPTGGFVIYPTVSRPYSRRIRDLVERCCSFSRQFTCSTAGLSAGACECRNAGWKCTGCYCWDRCKNRGRIMPSPTTARGLLGHFLCGADPPATDQRAPPPPVRSQTYLSLRAISEARARGRGAQGGAISRRSPRDGRGEGGWSRGGTRGGTRGGEGAMKDATEVVTRKTAATVASVCGR